MYMQHIPNILDLKSQSVMGGKLFSSYRAVFGLAQGLRDSKTIHLNGFYEAPERNNEHMYLHHFCVLSLSSVLEKGSYICTVILAH